MKLNSKSYKIIITVSLFAVVSLITISMFVKVRFSNTPEGVFENYKWWIVESVEKWTKDRDNEYYDKEKVLNWYETKNSSGFAPKSNFPDYIYKEIKGALILVFESQELSSKNPEEIKEVISDKLDSRKDNIVGLINSESKSNIMDSMTPALINIIFYVFLGFVVSTFIRMRLK